MIAQTQNLPVRNVAMQDYLALAPSALALERILEWRIYARLSFPRPVLDVGCGEGLFAHVLFSEPVDAGIDPNSRELERAREWGSYSELIHGFGDKIPKQDNTFQTVFSNSVLEHIPDLPPVLKEIHRVLAPGGCFYLTVPSHRFEEFNWPVQFLNALSLTGLSQRYRRFFNRFWRHHTAQELPKWKALLEEHGFLVESAQYYGTKKSCLLNDALVPPGMIGLLTKKLTNKWTLCPAFRRLYLAPLIPIFRNMNANAVGIDEGGLVFLSARKKSSETR
ncbi:MAG TPA: class I SAM-dependent methyltransferase [Planctomycetota bacterium]|jgi:SAM-dependent methyltransferase